MDAKTIELRDIHLPAPVSWWPLAPGWWALVAILLVALLAGFAWRRGTPTRRLRHAALAELSAIETAFTGDGNGHACAQALSRLLRRLALLVGDDAASARDFQSLSVALATLRAGPPPQELAALLDAAPYSPAAAAAIDSAHFAAATAALRPWLARLRPISRRKHAAF